jgi:tRNA A-37 threonylcarbamoyl transferase component Bud32
MADEQVKTKDFDISVFKRAMGDMVAKSAKAWNDNLNSYAWRKVKEYTKEEVERIINSSSITAM